MRREDIDRATRELYAIMEKAIQERGGVVDEAATSVEPTVGWGDVHPCPIPRQCVVKLRFAALFPLPD